MDRNARTPADEIAPDLSDIGYAGGYEEGDGDSGAIVHNSELVQPGYTLVCSGHASTVLLLDQQGEIVHEWHPNFDEIWPEPLPFTSDSNHKNFIRRARVLDSGDLLVVYEYIGMAKINKDSDVLWGHAGRCHHDIELLDDGRVMTLSMGFLGHKRTKKKFPGLKMKSGLADNSVLILDAEGRPQKEVSITRAIYTSKFGVSLSQHPWDVPDLLHANSVDWIDAEEAAAHPSFEEGNVLVSLRNPSSLVLIDLELERVTWMASGQWKQQHQAIALKNGNILIFDNLGGNQEKALWLDHSRAIEYHPPSETIVWKYPPKMEDRIFSNYLGYVQRLANGNTLITESTQGHVLEVTRGGELVWEYTNPFRAGAQGEFIATLMGARRLSPEEVTFLGD